MKQKRQPLFDLQLLSFIYNADFIKVWVQLSRQSRMWMSLVSSLSKHTIWRGLREQMCEIYYISTKCFRWNNKGKVWKENVWKMWQMHRPGLVYMLVTAKHFFHSMSKNCYIVCICKLAKKKKNLYLDNNQETSVSKSSVCETWGSIIDSHTVKYLVSAGIKWTRLDVYSVAYIFFWWSSFFSSQNFRYAVSFTYEILHSPHPWLVLCRGRRSRWTLTCCERQTNKLVDFQCTRGPLR